MMNESSKQTLQTVGAALIVGAIAGAAWFAIHTPREQPAVVVSAAGTVEAAIAPAVRSGDIAALLEVKPAPIEGPPPLAADEVRICGQTVSRTALAEEQIDKTLQDAGAGAALEAFAQQHLADSDHARAVGIVLRMQADANYREGGQASCKTDDCWKQQTKAHAERMAPLLTELATLAANSTDPRVMMLARDECAVLTADAAPSPHCQSLTARRLVAIDRDNAVAWLALAAEEPAAIDEAMHQASLARRWDDYATASRAFVERVDAKGGLRSLVVVQALMAVPAIRSIEDRQLVSKHCSDKPVAGDANRHQLCTKVAETLHSRSNSVAGLITAAALAKSLGQPNADRLEEQAALLNHVLLTQSLDGDAQSRDAQECSVGMPRDLLLRSAREGELPTLRAWMQASGQSEAQWREHMIAFAQAQVAGQITTTASAAAASAPP